MKNINKITSLPQKWRIRDCKEVAAWASETFGCMNIINKDTYLHINQSRFPSRDCYNFLYQDEIKPHYTEISLEQFKKYVLKQEDQPVMEKTIIGYNLIKPEFNIAARRIIGCNLKDFDKDLLTCINNEKDIELLRQANVLDIWFEPVYAKPKPRFKAGDWIVFDGDYHKGGPYKLKTISEDGGAATDHNGESRYTASTHYRLATVEEIESYLIEEAKRRGIVPGVTLAKTGINARFTFTFKPITRFNYIRGLDVLDTGYGHVYANGEWAEIVKEPEIQIKGYTAEIESGQVRFGCQTYSNEFIRTLASCVEKNNLNMDYKNSIIKLAKLLKD